MSTVLMTVLSVLFLTDIVCRCVEYRRNTKERKVFSET